MKLSQCLDRHNNNFDLLRLLLAALVIVGHAYALVPSAEGRGDFFQSLLGFDYAGSLAVKSFFFLSGLMVSNSPSLRHDLPGFIGARVFRIFPGLIACTLFCMAVMGPIMTRMPLGDYLTHPATRSYANNMLLNLQWTLPGVFEMNRMNAVNGSLWTLPYEVYSYGMLVALSLLGLMATPRLSTVLASGVIAAGFLVPDTMTTLKFGGEARLLPACFAFGVLMALHKDRIEVRASLATGLVLLTLLLKHSALFQPLVYLSLFYGFLVIASSQGFRKLRLPGDFSYGVYLYGFPAQQIAVAWWPQWDTLANQLFGLGMAATLAAISWYAVEKPSMRIGKRWITRSSSRAPKPASAPNPPSSPS